MNRRNQERQAEITDQLMSFQSSDATPTSDFAIEPTYTLIAHLPDHINAALLDTIQRLRQDYPEHYYYTKQQLHLTVVPVPTDRTIPEIISQLSPLLEGWELPIEARGLAVNRFQSGVVFYPGDESLVPMRRKMRAAMGMEEQQYTDHRSVWEELLWANMLRFTQAPSDRMLEDIRQYSKHDFGNFTLRHFELYSLSTKTLEPSSSKLLHTF